MSQVRTNSIVDASGGNTATINGVTPTVNNVRPFNRILNGCMRIDQRNYGASVTPTNGIYTIDRWQAGLTQASKFTVQRNAGFVTPPVGFTNYLGITSSSAYSVVAGDYFNIRQNIEGLNAADLAWGTSSAQPVTLSFWVRSSLTGAFGGSVYNGNGTRSYPFTYSISAANTWEYKTVQIAGDTTGTWSTDTGIGLSVGFGLGAGSTYSGTAGTWSGSWLLSATGSTSVVGTSGATFYITGVQLEAGSVASPFERVEYGEMLRRCQRYYEKSYNPSVLPGASGAQRGWSAFTTSSSATSEAGSGITFKVSKRDEPTVTVFNAVSGTSGQAYRVSDAASVGVTLSFIGTQGVGNATLASGSANSYYIHWAASAEL